MRERRTREKGGVRERQREAERREDARGNLERVTARARTRPGSDAATASGREGPREGRGSLSRDGNVSRGRPSGPAAGGERDRGGWTHVDADALLAVDALPDHHVLRDEASSLPRATKMPSWRCFSAASPWRALHRRDRLLCRRDRRRDYPPRPPPRPAALRLGLRRDRRLDRGKGVRVGVGMEKENVRLARVGRRGEGTRASREAAPAAARREGRRRAKKRVARRDGFAACASLARGTRGRRDRRASDLRWHAPRPPGRSLRGLRDRRVSVLFVRGCWLGSSAPSGSAIEVFAKRDRARPGSGRAPRSRRHLRRVPWERASWQSSGDVHWPSGAFTYSPSRPSGRCEGSCASRFPPHRTGAQIAFSVDTSYHASVPRRTSSTREAKIILSNSWDL